ncbi:MAG: response regulator transcription factor, partial [Angelakisella sp.]
MIRVLIAEDFDLLREDLTETLAAQPDITVVGSASSGAAIVELAKTTPCDIVLMDIEMERLNAGILAAEEIRDFAPNIKVIFLTAHETKQMILTAMGTGAVDYVVKGCPDEELLQHLHSAFAGKPMLDAVIQETVLEEYTRLRRSERSLLFFINNVSQLTAAERQLVKLLLEQKKVKEIADLRCVEVVTVKTQI